MLIKRSKKFAEDSSMREKFLFNKKLKFFLVFDLSSNSTTIPTNLNAANATLKNTTVAINRQEQQFSNEIDFIDNIPQNNNNLMTRRRRIANRVTEKLSSTWKHVGVTRKNTVYKNSSKTQTISPEESSGEIGSGKDSSSKIDRKISTGE